MGGQISITNKSTVPINVALSQVGALHYENCAQPGQTVRWTVGRVWFSARAIVDVPENTRSRYETFRDCVLPIGATVAGAVALGAGVTVVALAAIPAAGAGVGTAVAAGSSAAAAAEGAGASAAAVGGAAAATEATILTAETGIAVGTGLAAAGGVAGASAVVVSRGGPLVKAAIHGVYGGCDTRLVVTGNADAIQIRYYDDDDDDQSQATEVFDVDPDIVELISAVETIKAQYKYFEMI